MHTFADRGQTLRALRAMLVAILVAVIPLASLPTTAATPAAATPALATQAETRDLFVYLLRDGDIAAARRPIEVEDGRVGRASLLALIDGPTDEEEDGEIDSGRHAGDRVPDTQRAALRARRRRTIAQCSTATERIPGTTRPLGEPNTLLNACAGCTSWGGSGSLTRCRPPP